MANNRMWIVCTCGERFMLAKHFGAAWGTRAYVNGEIVPEALAGQLDDWFEEHTFCGLADYDGTHLRLEYEYVPPRRT